MMGAMTIARWTRSASIAALAAALLAPACSSAPQRDTVAAATVAPTTHPSTTQPAATTTSASSTSTSTSTSSSTTTSTSTTTLPRQLTTPVDPPADNGDEPVIELGTLSIPAIGVEMTMYEGIRMRTLDRGPGHWPGSAMPGELGNVVVGGHRTTHHRVFRDLDRLVAGDEIGFRDADGTEHVYLVDRVEIVTPDAMWVVNPTDTPTATLFACHPPGSTRERIIVFADLQH